MTCPPKSFFSNFTLMNLLELLELQDFIKPSLFLSKK